MQKSSGLRCYESHVPLNTFTFNHFHQTVFKSLLFFFFNDTLWWCFYHVSRIVSLHLSLNQALLVDLKGFRCIFQPSDWHMTFLADQLRLIVRFDTCATPSAAPFKMLPKSTNASFVPAEEALTEGRSQKDSGGCDAPVNFCKTGQ